MLLKKVFQPKFSQASVAEEAVHLDKNCHLHRRPLSEALTSYLFGSFSIIRILWGVGRLKALRNDTLLCECVFGVRRESPEALSDPQTGLSHDPWAQTHSDPEAAHASPSHCILHTTGIYSSVSINQHVFDPVNNHRMCGHESLSVYFLQARNLTLTVVDGYFHLIN